MGSVQSSEKADKQTCRRHHRGSGFCGFDYRAAVALANAQNYLKIYIRQCGAEKTASLFLYLKGDHPHEKDNIQYFI